MEFVKDFLIYEAGALCGFFIAALMNAARAGQEITIKFEEDMTLYGVGVSTSASMNCTNCTSTSRKLP